MEQRTKHIDNLILAFGDVERNPLDVEQYFRIFEQKFMTIWRYDEGSVVV